MSTIDCNLCSDFSDANLTMVRNHLRSVHHTKHDCQVKNCLFSFCNKKDLDNHRQYDHHGSRADPTVIKKHLKSVNHTKHNCEVKNCPFTFCDKKDLENHRQYCHRGLGAEQLVYLYIYLIFII